MDNNAKKQDSMYCTYTVCTVYCTYSLEPDSAFANPALGALGSELGGGTEKKFHVFPQIPLLWSIIRHFI